jgi:hypothetical protein
MKRYVCHSKKVLDISEKFGWGTGARYTNLRDVKTFSQLGFLDIDWKNYDFDRHLAAAKITNPELTVAQDVTDIGLLPEILAQAEELLKYAKNVAIIPKDIRLNGRIDELIPTKFILGYSVPTRYGGTEIPTEAFGSRPVHLLGGRPDTQRQLAELLNVVSIDTNRFTLDASFGKYFDGNKFIRHPKGGYVRCLEASLLNMNKLWEPMEG